MKKARLLGMVFALAVAAPLAGCAQSYIANTDVEDSPANRELIDFCENYRRAVERKDVAALLEMISEDYYENGGNSDASDDMDYAQFKAFLTGESKNTLGFSFQDATGIRHEIRYRRITRQDNRIYVDYTFSASFRVPTNTGDAWKRKVDENRLELILDDSGHYKIVAGM
ncbi:MAG: hypothetical protein U0271_10820 [Polyangiaceae bacterium]